MGEISDKKIAATKVAQLSGQNTLSSLFNMFRKKLLLELETVMPAIVIEYDRNTHVALVQPLMRRIDVERNQLVQPQIEVEVRRIYSGDYLIDIPLHPYDTGWVVASERDATTVKAKNPDQEGKYNGADEPDTGVLHSYINGYFIPDRWGDYYMPLKEEEKVHLTDFDDADAPQKIKSEKDPEVYTVQEVKENDSTYGDIEESKNKIYENYRKQGMLDTRSKDDLAEIAQPDGKGGSKNPEKGGKEAREFNTDYDRLVIQSKDRKQRITMGQKDIKVYSSNLIYVNSQKDIIAYARENLDVHVGDKVDGKDNTEGMVNIYSNKNIKVTCATYKKEGVIDVCSDGKMLVHSPDITIDGDSPFAADPQVGPRTDVDAKTENLPTNIKVHANNVNIACTKKPDAKGGEGKGTINVSADTNVDIHAPVVNIDGGKPNPTKPATGDPVSGVPGTVNILGNVNITGDTKITGAVTVDGTGTVTATEEVKAKTIALTSHTHTGCQGGSTGAPIP